VSEPVTRDEFRMLADTVARTGGRLDSIDQSGTRGVAVLAVQLQELAKDVASLSTGLAAHERSHAEHDAQTARARADEARARIAGRRWMAGAAIALLAAIDGPMLYLIGRH
jgi:hypothetical protein